MRRRLLLSTLAVAVVSVLLLGIPLAYSTERLIYDEAQQQVEREAATVVAGVNLREEMRQSITGDQIGKEFPGRYIVVSMADGTEITAGEAPAKGDHVITKMAANDRGIRVQVSRDAADVEADAVRTFLLIGSLVVLGVGVAVALAMVQARKLTLPLIDLAETAERLGSGNARPRRRRYGVPEVDRVAEVLDSSAVRIADLFAASREFASDASHQLRTPLTALSMRLEEMIEAAEYPDVVREEGAAAAAQVERLAAVVEQLLARAKHDPTGDAVPIGVDEIVTQQVKEWEPVFRRESRRIDMSGVRGLTAVVSPGGLSQIVATLLDNSLVHGDGRVTIHTKETPASIVVEVGDEGAGVPPELERRVFDRNVSGRQGTGLGLYLARSLATADGGRLELVRSRPATFAIFLRKREEALLAKERVVSGPA
ncbi:two-component system sensor histidine kinase DraK [Actinoallomurus bryophytorum]|uniref:Signal transduction histidine-protein kinase/phosphatase MprB n=1 Tax=Actinoallomurus bryophytorum TaxID=1490222 RepID=A0A543CMJ8_9ACTN|nr:ATP-binding protein [Actinoallomurus bryophytorum]TQL98299.1 signal transduction histidine kinase [Actinoallomurus bryophytorum]